MGAGAKILKNGGIKKMKIFTSIKIKNNKFYILNNSNIIQAQTNTKEKAKELAKEFYNTDKKIFKSDLLTIYWIMSGQDILKNFEIAYNL